MRWKSQFNRINHECEFSRTWPWSQGRGLGLKDVALVSRTWPWSHGRGLGLKDVALVIKDVALVSRTWPWYQGRGLGLRDVALVSRTWPWSQGRGRPIKSIRMSCNYNSSTQNKNNECCGLFNEQVYPSMPKMQTGLLFASESNFSTRFSYNDLL